MCKDEKIRTELDKQSGFISNGMSRKAIKPRNNYETRLESFKVLYYDDEGITWSDCEYTDYWDERGKVTITQKGEKEILEATF